MNDTIEHKVRKHVINEVLEIIRRHLGRAEISGAIMAVYAIQEIVNDVRELEEFSVKMDKKNPIDILKSDVTWAIENGIWNPLGGEERKNGKWIHDGSGTCAIGAHLIKRQVSPEYVKGERVGLSTAARSLGVEYYFLRNLYLALQDVGSSASEWGLDAMKDALDLIVHAESEKKRLGK